MTSTPYEEPLGEFVKIVRNLEPSDANYRGFDILVLDVTGAWACVEEAQELDEARAYAVVAQLTCTYRNPAVFEIPVDPMQAEDDDLERLQRVFVAGYMAAKEGL